MSRKNVKRTRIQRERDMAEIARLYLQGKTQQQIAEYIGRSFYGDPEFLSRQMIAKDLAAVYKLWQREAVLDLNQAIITELARIDQLERTFWEAWARSQDDIKTRTVRERGKKDKAGSELVIMSEERTGDPRYLDGIMKCIERRCRLLGLDAPKQTRIDANISEGSFEINIVPEGED